MSKYCGQGQQKVTECKKNKVVGIPFLNTHMKEFFKYLAYLLMSYAHFILSILVVVVLLKGL